MFGESCRNDEKIVYILSSKIRVMVLSHWPHVAEQVQQQLQQLVAELVEQHVASVKAPLDVRKKVVYRRFRLPVNELFDWMQARWCASRRTTT